MITKKRIGVLAGGTSAEREVSLRSGAAVHKALVERGYDAVFIDAGTGLYEELTSRRIEVAFIVLHGGHGENGALQGFLEVLGIPYTGSGVLASAAAMDKETSKKLFCFHGIPVPPFTIVWRRHPETGKEATAEGLWSEGVVPFDLPWVVKPATEGSSIGVHIVKERASLGAALADAFSFGGRIIVERYVQGKEIQIGILGDRALGGVEVRPSTEFYDYKAKYTPGMTRYILPPEIGEADYELLRRTALAAHRALGCSGATRVDLILDDAGRPYVLEVNTIPGMTETSLLPKIAALDGLGFGDLVEAMLRSALGEER